MQSSEKNFNLITEPDDLNFFFFYLKLIMFYNINSVESSKSFHSDERFVTLYEDESSFRCLYLFINSWSLVFRKNCHFKLTWEYKFWTGRDRVSGNRVAEIFWYIFHCLVLSYPPTRNTAKCVLQYLTPPISKFLLKIC